MRIVPSGGKIDINQLQHKQIKERIVWEKSHSARPILQNLKSGKWVKRFVYIKVGKSSVNGGSKAFNSHFKKGLEKCADYIEGKEEYKRHNSNKWGNGGILTC